MSLFYFWVLLASFYFSLFWERFGEKATKAGDRGLKVRRWPSSWCRYAVAKKARSETRSGKAFSFFMPFFGGLFLRMCARKRLPNTPPSGIFFAFSHARKKSWLKISRNTFTALDLEKNSLAPPICLQWVGISPSRHLGLHKWGGGILKININIQFKYIYFIWTKHKDYQNLLRFWNFMPRNTEANIAISAGMRSRPPFFKKTANKDPW